MADYVGFERSDRTVWQPQFRACEVKEASGNSMPHSRLSDEQRTYMENLPAGCGFVGILWPDNFEIFPYTSGRGSYNRGEGLK